MIDMGVHHEVGEVLLRYSTAIDTKDWELLRSCFTGDCVLDYGEIGLWRSPDEVAAFMAESHATCPHSLHRITNIVVKQTGTETASARSYVDGLILLDATTAVHPHGVYDDKLVRTAGDWKIARRHFTLILMQMVQGFSTDKGPIGASWSGE